MKLISTATLLLAVAVTRSHQKTSPCPAVFSYDEQEDTPETWYGTMRLTTNVPLHGIFIDVIFDGQVYVFGAYFKDVTTKDNLRFHIEDKSYRLNAGETLILKFNVKHSAYGQPPLLRQIRFNGQNVCVDIPSVDPETLRTPKPVMTSYDTPVAHPEHSTHRGNRPDSNGNKHGSSMYSVQPISPIMLPNTNVLNTNTPPNTRTSEKPNAPIRNNNSVVDPSVAQVNPSNLESRFSGVPHVPKQPSGHQNRPHSDPIQDPTIWKKPSDGSTSTARSVRQPIPNYDTSQHANNYANARTPAPTPRNRESEFRTTSEASFFQGDYTRQPSGTTTKKAGYFQGDYAFIQNVETSTHYINSYEEDICGTVVPKANPLVTHGAVAQQAQFPWHGALYRSTVTELKYLCGSTLISPKFALTAAHCVALEKSQKPVDAESLLLYLGKTNLKKWTGPEQDAKIERIAIHPDYNYERFFADIALLELKDDVKFSHFIRPACLWNFDEDYKILINKVGFVPGWGYTERGLVSEELSFAQMPVVAHETCIWSNRDFFSKVTSNTSFCAGFRNGTSVCNGDSGGGMVFKQGNKWFLRGVVSVSAALQNNISCDPNHYAVFTDVAKFLRWIKSFMQ